MSNADACELLCIDLDRAEELRQSRVARKLLSVAAERARAFGDATRLDLALALDATEELCVCDLAWIIERSQNLVSQHLRTLKAAGLVTPRREGKMVMYSLTLEGRALLGAVIAQAQEASLP